MGLKSFTGHFYFFNTNNATFENRGQAKPQHLNLLEEEQNGFSGNYGQLAISEALTRPNSYLGYLFSPDTDTQDIRVFEYYVRGLCPQLSNSLTDNPYLELLAPLSLESLPVYHAILSWSAHELAQRDPSAPHYRQLSVKHKGKALQCLQDDLRYSQNSHSPSHAALVPILATMILLSCQEITESCSAAWITHLKAARTLCSLLWPVGPNSTDRFRKFCIMWLVSHEMMSRTAWVDDTLFEPGQWF